MPDLSSDIQTGYSAQTAFDIKLDTARTLDSILNRPSNPANIPQVDLTHPAFRGQSTSAPEPIPNMSIGQALLSKDPKIKDLAHLTLKQSAQADPYTALGLGNTIKTPLEQAQKFINRKYGFDALNPDTEDYYYRNEYQQKPWYKYPENVAIFAERAIVGAAHKFGEGLGYLGSSIYNGFEELFNGKESNFWADVADNTFSKIMREGDENFRNQVIPVFKQAGFDEKGFFSKLGDATFWNDSVADGVAFIGSAFIPMGIASKAGWLARGAGLFGNTNKLARGANAVTKFMTGAETWGEAGMAAFNVANEAAFEASGTYRESKEALLRDRAAGRNIFTDEQIEQQAGSRAAKTFGWNTLALMGSNAWEMRNIFKPMLGITPNAKIVNSRVNIGETGEASLRNYKTKFLNTRVGKAVPFYSKRIVGATLAEGFWEENIQTAIGRSSAGEYNRRGDDTSPEGEHKRVGSGFYGIMEQYGRQTQDALVGNDREVAESVGIGAIIGGGFGSGAGITMRVDPRTGQRRFLSERRVNELATIQQIDKINNAYNDALSLRDAFNADGTINQNVLKTKIAAFQDLDEKQALINQIKKQNTHSIEDVKALENSLLNNYGRALARAGKLDDAIARFEAMAGRPLNGETMSSNPVEAAAYLSEIRDIYNQIENQNIQYTIPKGISPQQMEVNIRARKDRAFDLRAERRALKPVFDAHDEQINRQFENISRELQASFIGKTTEEALAHNNATDLIRANSKKAFFRNLAQNENVPRFLKDFYNRKIEEANNELKTIKEFLGDKTPVIDKDGKLLFKDDTLNTISANNQESFDKLLSVYRDGYNDKAQLEFLQEQNEAIADAITHPVEGLRNWFEYQVLRVQEVEEEVAPPETVPPVPQTETPPVVTTLPEQTSVIPEDNPEQAPKTNKKEVAPDDVLAETLQNTSAIPDESDPIWEEIVAANMEQQQDEYWENTVDLSETNIEEEQTSTEQPVVEKEPEDEITVTENVVELEEPSKESTEEVDDNKPITYITSLVTAKNDTRDGGDSEVLRNVPYREMVKEFLASTDPKTFNTHYNLFIVKDGFREIYNPPFNMENPEGFIPQGVVIVVERKDGTRPTIGELLPETYRKFKKVNPNVIDPPIVFPMYGDKFFNTKYEARVKKYTEKEGKTVEEVKAIFEKEREARTKARQYVIDHPDAKVKVELNDISSGIMPILDSGVTDVISRFGNDFTLSVQDKENTKYKKGAVLAKFKNGGAEFPVIPASVGSRAEDLTTLEQILEKEHDSFDIANELRNQYLNLAYYTTENNFFYIKKQENGKWKISYVRLEKGDYNKTKEEKKKIAKAGTAPGDISKLRFNVKTEALRKGINIYDPVTGIYTSQSPEEYREWIKQRVVTNLKKVTDHNGNLYMKPINSHLSYKIVDDKINDNTPQVHKETYDNLTAHIKQLKEKNQLTNEAIDGLIPGIKKRVQENKLKQEDADKVLKRLEELRVKKENTPEVVSEKMKSVSEKLIEEIKTPTSVAEKAAALKKKKAGQKVVNLTEVLEGTPSAPLEYTTEVGGNGYELDPKTGNLFKKMGNAKFGAATGTPVYFTVLENLSKKLGWSKNMDGSVSGVYMAQLDTGGYPVFAYGLPSGQEIFVQNGKQMTGEDADGFPTNPIEEIEKMLTEEGKAAFEAFQKRNC